MFRTVSSSRSSRVLITSAVLLLAATVAHAAPTPEQQCLARRTSAHSKYEQCVGKWLAKFYAGEVNPDEFTAYAAALAKLAKCRIKYARTWSRLQGLGTTCAAASRYTDNGDGTVTDNLTGLVWEKKSDNGDIHDKDSFGTWAAGASLNGTGTAFTTFVREGLNAGAGFAGANDWRLPTFVELQTIMLPESYPCSTSPCIDAAFNTSCAAGCVATACSCTSVFYWSATTLGSLPSAAWGVNFTDGYVYYNYKFLNDSVRAVRGGL